jgi:hypothetical protein
MPRMHFPAYRLMVQTQQLWVSELSRATGRTSYGVCGPALQVLLPEALVGSCHLGHVVHMIGHTATGPSSSSSSSTAPAGASSCCIQVGSGNLHQYTSCTTPCDLDLHGCCASSCLSCKFMACTDST